MENVITLVTSIAPKNVENQKRAICSWTRQGFRVISCNVKAERQLVEPLFPEVEFVEVTRDAGELVGKPCPYIYDMLKVLEKKAGGICGIVNSDIHLRSITREMYLFLLEEAEKSPLFMRRQEIKELSCMDSLDSRMFFGGIDVFLFQKDLIHEIGDDGLIMGQAMWDYWLPIMFDKHGIRIRELINPVIFHVTHTVQWNDDITDVISWDICRKHFQTVRQEEAVFYLKDRFFQLISKPDLAVCYLSEEEKHKKLLIVEAAAGMAGGLDRQKFPNITCIGKKYDSGDDTGFDYVIELPYRIEMNDAFAAACIWIMENYQISAARLPVYLRGNRSGAMKIENCNDRMLDHFNRDIWPIIIRKSGSCCNGLTERAELPSCRICLCSVIVEEDEATIWERDKIPGRIVIFPAGHIAKTWVKRFLPVAKEATVLGFSDHLPGLHHKVIENLEIVPPEALKNMEWYDKVLIITNLYADEIYSQLMETIPRERLFIWNEFDGTKWLETKEQIVQTFSQKEGLKV